jgi:TRAP-type C4-dicarboxylate transport system substrate-binding protein
MKKMLILLLVTVFVLMSGSLLAACGNEGPADEGPANEGPADEGPADEGPTEPVVLKISTTLPPDQSAILEQMAESFNERAAAYNYSIEVYPGGVLASMEEAMDMVMTGAVDMAEIGLSAAMTHDLRFGAGTGIPFLINDMDASIKYVQLINDNLFSGIMEDDFNQKIIFAWPSPPLYWCGIKPVETLEDWDGLLVHTMSTLQSDAVEALGASSVSMPFFDVVPSMEKGAVDGGVNLNGYVIAMMNWFDSFKYITVADMFCGFISFNINLEAFNAMPTEVQTILLEEGEIAGQTLTDMASAGDTGSIQACIDAGIDVYYLPDTERARWIDATQAVRDAYFAQLDPGDAQIIMDAAAEANAD